MVRKAIHPESYEEALTTALKLMQRMAQTERQIRDKLAARMYESGIVNKVVDRLKYLKMIDDEKYARDYIAYRSRSAPLGGQFLKLKLIQKGIDKSLAEESIKEITSDDELVLARGLAEKRIKHYTRFDKNAQKEKLARFLLARGFKSSVVYTIIKEL